MVALLVAAGCTHTSPDAPSLQTAGLEAEGTAAPPPAYRTFRAYCEDAEAAPGIRKTVEAVQRALATTSCEDTEIALVGRRKLDLDYPFDVVADLAPVAMAPDLEELSVSWADVNDFAPLTALPKLQKLALHAARYPDLSALPRIPKLAELVLNTSITHLDIASIQRILGLRTLDVPLPDDATSFLAGLPQTLEKLRLHNGRDLDLSPLARLPLLTSLDVEASSLRAQSLSLLVGLEHLSVSGDRAANEVPGDLSFVARLTKLRELSVANLAWSEKVVDYAPIAALPELVSLSIRVARPSDLATLATLGTLRTLRVSGDWFEDSTNFGLFTNLEAISFQATNLRDLSFAKSLPHLKSFVSAWNPGIRDLSPLSGLTDLEELSIFDNHVSDLSPLRRLTKLRILDLGKYDRWGDTPAPIRDLAPLQGLTMLEEVTLYDNEIEDLSPLSSMTHLRALNVHTNHIRSVEPLRGLDALVSLSISSNPVQSLAPLRDLPRLKELAAWSTPVARGEVARTEETCPTNAASTVVNTFCSGPLQTW